MDFSETIEIKVVDRDDHFSVDSYFFAYFRDIAGALNQIRDAVRNSRNLSRGATPQPVLDTTQQPRAPLVVTTPHTPKTTTFAAAATSDQAVSPRAGGFRLSSLWRGLSDTGSAARMQAVPENASQQEEFTHITKRGETSFVPMTTSPKPLVRELSPTTSKLDSSQHTYPPSPTPSETLQIHPKEVSSSGGSSAWSVGVPAWLKMPRPSRRLSLPATSEPVPGAQRVSEVYSHGPPHSGPADVGFSESEGPGAASDNEAQEKFRAAFAFGEEEALYGRKCSQHVRYPRNITHVEPRLPGILVPSHPCSRSGVRVHELLLLQGHRSFDL